jgi:hypothetical protein
VPVKQEINTVCGKRKEPSPSVSVDALAVLFQQAAAQNHVNLEDVLAKLGFQVGGHSLDEIFTLQGSPIFSTSGLS